MKKITRYFIILAIITILAATFYYYISTLPADPMKGGIMGMILAFMYMPAPLYAYMINQSLSKESYAVNKFFDKSGLTLKNFFLTIGMFITWAILLLGVTFLLGKIFPSYFGTLITDTESLARHISSLNGSSGGSANVPFGPIFLVIMSFVSAIIAGFTINLLFALGEEISWRGYLMQEFAHLPFVKRNLLIGAIWGIWHAPIIIQGYNYGTSLAIPGVFAFILFCIGFSFAFGVIADKTKNVLFAGALHGMFNAFAGVFILILTSYHPFIGGAIGILSALVWMAVAFIVKHNIR